MDPGGLHDALASEDDTDSLSNRVSSRPTSSSSSSTYSSTVSSDVGAQLSAADLDGPFVLPDSLPAVALSESIERDLLCMVGTPAPAGRLDLEQSATELTESKLRSLLVNAQRITRIRFPQNAAGHTAQWEDASAIALYTSDSAVYRIVNGYLSAPNSTLRDVLPVARMVRRIYEAVRRLGTPYAGPAYRVLKACKTGSVAMQAAYANYKVDFAVGVPIDMHQFASFTKAASTVSDFARNFKTPVIVLSCGVVDGFDVSQYSMIPEEGEVICLPPSRFKVCAPPLFVGTTVLVGIETLKRAAARPRSPLFASSLGVVTVGSPSDPVIPRASLLNGIDVGLHNAHQRYVLYGPKGVGKSYLAHRYGQQWIAKGGRYHVRWFSAANREVLQGEYRAFLKDSFGTSDPNPEDLQPAVRRLFASTPNVLLIFDGVEDEAMLEQFLHSLLPIRGQAAPNVFVLITSSSSTLCETGIWAELQGQHRKEVPVFTDEETANYLTQALTEGSGAAASLLADPLFQIHVGNHPKRLQWVSALLRNNPIEVTVELLVASIKANVVCGTVNPVFTAVIDALVAHCNDKNTKGWEMLRLAAQLADAPIPVELLRLSMEITDDEADDAISSLTQWSLVTLVFIAPHADDCSTPCVVLHSLAREEATRYDIFYSNNSADLCAAPGVHLQHLHALNALFSSMPHLCYHHALWLTSVDTLCCTHSDQEATATLQNRMASYMYRMGQYKTALDHAVLSLNHWRTIHASEARPGIASSLSNIGKCYNALGDHRQALQYSLEALEMRRTVLPDPHPDIASSLSNIGKCCNSLGDHKQALQFCVDALEMRRKVLPDPHPDIASSLSRIGKRYSELGDHKQALRYGLEALEMRRKVLPDPHPDIASSLSDITDCCNALGDHEQALQYGTEALEIRRKVLPNPHADIASSLRGVVGPRPSEGCYRCSDGSTTEDEEVSALGWNVPDGVVSRQQHYPYPMLKAHTMNSAPVNSCWAREENPWSSAGVRQSCRVWPRLLFNSHYRVSSASPRILERHLNDDRMKADHRMTMAKGARMALAGVLVARLFGISMEKLLDLMVAHADDGCRINAQLVLEVHVGGIHDKVRVIMDSAEARVRLDSALCELSSC